MKLSGPQTEKLREIIIGQFEGDATAFSDFAQFVFDTITIDPISKGWTTANLPFPTQVSHVLRRMSDENLTQFLRALKERAQANGASTKAQTVSSIEDELQRPRDDESERSRDSGGTRPRKILVAHGRADKRFAEDVRRLLQDAMDDFEVVGAWENKYRLPEDIDDIGIIVALLTVIPPQKAVNDPPLNAVMTALECFGPERRLVLLALDPRAKNWTEATFKDIDVRDFVDTQPFFDDDGKPLFLKQSRFIEAAIDFRIAEIAEKLRHAFDEAVSSSERCVSASPRASSNGARSPVVLLGDPHGQSSADVARIIRDLTAELERLKIRFERWPDGWAKIRQPPRILLQDPIFVRPVAEDELETKKAAEDLDNTLRAAFDVGSSTADPLSACRRVLWRTGGPAWTPTNGDPYRSTDDIDNLETRVAEPGHFAKWLARFISPDAVIFHEPLGESRPPGLIRLLRDTFEECLSTPDRKPIIRLRSFNELPSLGSDKLTIVAVDDLPLARSVDFREKVHQRLDEFRYRIDYILRQLPEEGQPAVLPVAVLMQNGGFNERGELRTWKPFRVKTDEAPNFRVEETDVAGLREATAELMERLNALAQVEGSRP